MFNQGDNTGFDLINHAIRMGTMEEVLRRNELLRQLNGANAAFLGRQSQPGQQPPPHAPTQNQLAAAQQSVAVLPSRAGPGEDRLNPNAFQFPWKLHDMLDNAAADGFVFIVSWAEDGRSFRVHKPPKFVESVMPIYFKQTKYKSFQRQLNLYGFTRINEGPAKGGYRHKYFVRGQRSLCQLISRSSTSEAPAGTEPCTSPTQMPLLRTAQPSNASLLAGDDSVAAAGSSTAEPNAKPDARDCPPVTVASRGSPSITGTGTNPMPIEASRAINEHAIDNKSDDYYKSLVHKEFQFPWKLHEMLERSMIDSFEQIVSWQPGNFCFKVQDPTKFVNSVMPRFFKQTKYKSFQRQLNLYGFTRIDEGPNKGSYRHPFFLKDRKDLLNSMTRQKIRGDKQANPQPQLPEDSVEAMETELVDTPPVSVDSGIPAVLTAIKRSEITSSQSEENDGTDSEDVAAKEASSEATIPVSADGLSWRQNPSESFSDWMLEVIHKDTREKEVYHVHRRVLAVGPKRSEYFARLFKKTNSSNKSLIELGKVEASVFPLVLDHVYADVKLHLNTDKAYALYCLAEHLEISSVLQAVTEFFCKNMNKENVVDYITLAKGFRDQTLLQAAVGKCAEEMRSMDQAVAAKMEPELLLQVLLKSKTLPRNYKCGSSRLSQLIAECVQIHCKSMTREIFQRLTDKEHLPFIESEAAIKLLSAENKLFNGSQGSRLLGNPSLHERCVFSITKNWEELRVNIEKNASLSENMESISSKVLYEILMKATETSEPSE